jgi:hypothetical protein
LLLVLSVLSKNTMCSTGHVILVDDVALCSYDVAVLQRSEDLYRPKTLSLLGSYELRTLWRVVRHAAVELL